MYDRALTPQQIAGLVALGATALGSAVAIVINGQNVTPGRIVSAVVAIAVLISVVRSRGGNRLTRATLALVSVVGLAIIASLFGAPDMSQGLVWATLAVFGLIGFTIQFWYASQSPDYASVAFAVLLALWFLLIVVTLGEYVSQIHFANSHVFIDQRLSGRIPTLTWVNPNNTPFILTVLVTPVLYAARRRPSWVRRAVWVGIGWLVFLSIFVNDARLGTVVLIMSLILWVILETSDWRIALATTTIAIAAVVPATFISQQTSISDLAPYSPVSQWSALFDAARDVEDIPSAPSSVPADTSTGNRIRLWTKAFDITFSHPFIGLGAGGYQFLLTTGDEFLGIEDPHSLFLDAGSNLGLLGAVALIAALALTPITVVIRDRRSMLGHVVIVATFAFAAGSFGPSTTWTLSLAWAALGLVQGAWISTRLAHVGASSDDPDTTGNKSSRGDRQQRRLQVGHTRDHDGSGNGN